MNGMDEKKETTSPIQDALEKLLHVKSVTEELEAKLRKKIDPALAIERCDATEAVQPGPEVPNPHSPLKDALDSIAVDINRTNLKLAGLLARIEL